MRHDDPLPERYAQLLSAAVGVPCPPSDCLEDVDGGFYCTCYLRAWAFEAQLRDHLKSRFGSDWFRRRAAGDLLRELWGLGQSLRAKQRQDLWTAERTLARRLHEATLKSDREDRAAKRRPQDPAPASKDYEKQDRDLAKRNLNMKFGPVPGPEKHRDETACFWRVHMDNI